MSAAVPGFTVRESKFGPQQTADRLAGAIARHGLTLLARIDHAAAAANAGMTLRPTEVFIFGNPKGGTPLMKQAQTIGIDLPLKALVWQDEAGKTWCGYNAPEWLAARHGVDSKPALDAMAVILAQLVQEAIG